MASSAPRSADALTLLLAGDVLVDAAAVRDLRGAMPGSVRTAAGRLVGVICPINEAPACASRAGFWTGSPEPGLPPDTSLAGTRIATGLVVPLEAAGSAARLERALLEHLADRAPGDSYLAALLDRPMSRPLTRLLLRSRADPVARHAPRRRRSASSGATGLATVSYWGRLLGVLLLIASLVLDCVDGDMARARLAQSPTGARLDLIGDYLVNLAVFGGLCVGLLREGLPPGGAWAALVLITGVGAAMAAVHVLFIRPVLRRGEDLHWTGDDESLRGKPGATVVEKLASRDYTYLLLVLALVGPPGVVPLRRRRSAHGRSPGSSSRTRVAGRARTPSRRPRPGDRAPARPRRAGLPRRSASAVLAGTVWAIGVDASSGTLRLIGWGLAADPAGREPERPPQHRRLGPRRSRVASGRSACAGCWRLAWPATAINYLTPSATVGGELLRVRLLGHTCRRAPVGIGERRQGRPVGGAGRLHLPRTRAGPAAASRRSPLDSGGSGALAAVVAGAAAILAAAAFVWTVGRGFWATARGALGRVRLGEAPAAVVGGAGPGPRRGARATRSVAHGRLARLLRPGVGGGGGRDLPDPALGGRHGGLADRAGARDRLGAPRWYALLRARARWGPRRAARWSSSPPSGSARPAV